MFINMDNSYIKCYNRSIGVAEAIKLKPEETFYKIELKTVPKFLFCWSATVHGYENEFSLRRDYLEICFVEHGHILCTEHGGTFTVEPQSLQVLTKTTDCRFATIDGEEQRHATVGISAEYDITELSEEQARRESASSVENVIVLPRLVKFDKKTFDSLVLKLKRMTAKRYSRLRESGVRLLGEWFGLCAEIAEAVFSVGSFAPSSDLYVEKIVNLVSVSPARVSVPELAKSLQISEGYMQTIFKSVTGKTIIEYVNERKVRAAAEMKKSRGMKLKEIAAELGFEDAAYLSRLFKKVMGVSFSGYARGADAIELSGVPPKND